MSRAKKRQSAKTKYLWPAIWVVISLLVLSGLMLLRDAGYLKTQTVGGGSAEGADYTVSDSPAVEVGSTEITGCTTPLPTPSSTTRSIFPPPNVLGISVGGGQCLRGGYGPFPRDYIAGTNKQKIKVPINGQDLREIISTSCGLSYNGPSKPLIGCPDDALGCAWAEIPRLNARINVLYDIAGTNLFSMAKGWVRDGDKVAWAEGAYPAATPTEGMLLYNMKMRIWTLSDTDRQKISDGLEPESERKVLNHLRLIERHEETHWMIYQWAQNNYINALSNPLDDYSKQVNNPLGLRLLAQLNLMTTLENIHECEAKMQSLFETKYADNIYSTGLWAKNDGVTKVGECPILILDVDPNELFAIPTVPGCNDTNSPLNTIAPST